MADAKSCDRCGKFYNKNLTSPLFGDTRSNLEILNRPFGRYTVAVIRDGLNTAKAFDLCDYCLGAFQQFMNIAGIYDEKEETNNGKETVQSCGGSL